MTQQEMLFLVPQKLKEIEKEYGIRILYAVESGSRAWGTNAPTSDFDIRFLYIRPREDYLRLDPIRDVLEFPIDEGWDMCGWDLTKVLQLLHNSNSQIYEWLASPLVYVGDGFSSRFRPVLDAYFSTKTVANHYLHQADMKMKAAAKAERPKVKHYLYSLQHLAAAQWVLTRQAPSPVSFQQLMEQMQGDIRREAQALLMQKTTQQPLTDHIPFLDAWLAEERSRIHQQIGQLPREPEKYWELLNRFFLSELDRQ